MRQAIFLAALVALSACDLAQLPSGAGKDTCGASRYAHLRGGPESGVLAIGFNQPVRIISPRDQVTTDLVADRLNFELDAAGSVVGITCG